MGSEPYIPAYEFDFWLGAFQPGISTFEYSETHSTWDTTVHKDRGATSVGIAEYTCNVRFECPVKKTDESAYPKSGQRLVGTFIDGGEVHTGSIAITSRRKRNGARGGKVWSYEGVFSGAVSGVSAGATS